MLIKCAETTLNSKLVPRLLAGLAITMKSGSCRCFTEITKHGEVKVGKGGKIMGRPDSRKLLITWCGPAPPDAGVSRTA